MRSPRTATKSSPHSPQPEKSLRSNEDPTQPKIKINKIKINKFIFLKKEDDQGGESQFWEVTKKSTVNKGDCVADLRFLHW